MVFARVQNSLSQKLFPLPADPLLLSPATAASYVASETVSSLPILVSSLPIPVSSLPIPVSQQL